MLKQLSGGKIISINALAPGDMDAEMCANMTQERKDETTVRLMALIWLNNQIFNTGAYTV